MPENNALHTAVEGGDLGEVQSQVNNFDINAKGQYSETALCKAAKKGHIDVVQLLLTLNPGVNIPDVSTIKPKSDHVISYVLVYSIHFAITLILSLSWSLHHLLQVMTFNDTDTSSHCFIKSSPAGNYPSSAYVIYYV